MPRDSDQIHRKFIFNKYTTQAVNKQNKHSKQCIYERPPAVNLFPESTAGQKRMFKKSKIFSQYLKNGLMMS